MFGINERKYEIAGHNYHPLLQFNDDDLYGLIKKLLTDQEIKSTSYALGIEDQEDSYCIHKEGDLWVVYFSERGKRIKPCFFSSCMDAVDFFVWKLLEDKKKFPTIDWKAL